LFWCFFWHIIERVSYRYETLDSGATSSRNILLLLIYLEKL